MKVRRESGLDGQDGQNATSFDTIIDNNETRGLLHYQHTADNWVNDARLSYQTTSYSPRPNGSGIAQIFQISTGGTILNYGGGLNLPEQGPEGFHL